ncbi:transposase DDE domain protein, partial [Leptospira noguchii str. 2007001578]
REIQLITKLKKNMKNKLMPFRKRAIIESVNDDLKISARFNILDIGVFAIGPLIF